MLFRPYPQVVLLVLHEIATEASAVLVMAVGVLDSRVHIVAW